MSLVIEALRRVEKTDARTGSLGAAVASYRPSRRPRRSAVPLLLGLVTGGALAFVFGSESRNTPRVSAHSVDEPSAPRPHRLKGAAGLPPPLIIEPVGVPQEVKTSSAPGSLPRAAASPAPPVATPSLVLQAISERDSHPIAIINDQLVKEGDKLGSVRVKRIGADSVEVLLENGKSDTVRFAPPPPPAPEASPSPSPHP